MLWWLGTILRKASQLAEYTKGEDKNTTWISEG